MLMGALSMSYAQLPEGFKQTTFAAPPNVSYPAGLCVSPHGEVFVSQDLNSSLDREPDRGSIVRCVDTNGDGAADVFTKYVEHLDSPRGSCYVDGTLYVVGRFRNAGDSRTGIAAGTRGLELAIFASCDNGSTFEKVVSWDKAAVSWISCHNFKTNSCISFRIPGSSAPKGSSNNNIFGFFIKV